MERRFHRGFTAAEKTELWDRWKRGESLKAIGRAFGKESSSIYFLVAPYLFFGVLPQNRAGHRRRFHWSRHAGTGHAAGIARSFASFLRFCAVAASRNSSRAPIGPRNLRRPSRRMRLR